MLGSLTVTRLCSVHAHVHEPSVQVSPQSNIASQNLIVHAVRLLVADYCTQILCNYCAQGVGVWHGFKSPLFQSFGPNTVYFAFASQNRLKLVADWYRPGSAPQQ